MITMTAKHSMLFLAALVLLLVLPAHTISDLPLRTFTHTVGDSSRPFATLHLTANEARSARGMTIMTMLEDCQDQLRLEVTRQLPTGLTITTDRSLCATYIHPTAVGTLTSIGQYNFLLRSVKMYMTTGKKLPTSVRLGWIYWMDQDYIVGNAVNQFLYYCPPPGTAFVDWDVAKEACYAWMPETNQVTARIAAPMTERLEWLLQYLRSKDGRAIEYTPFDNQPIGHVSWIGHHNVFSSWDNGIPISYDNFKPGFPSGDYPTVMDQNGEWKSVLRTEKHAYCCESTGIGGIARDASAMIEILTQPNAAIEAAIVNATMAFDDPAFYPFKLAKLSTNPSHTHYGFSAAFPMEDCDGTFRFVTPATSPDPTLLYEHHVALCQVMIRSVVEHAPADPLAIGALAKQIRLASISTDDKPPVGQQGPPVRISWIFWVEDPTPLFVNHFPMPHGYFCRHASLESSGAAAQCAGYGDLNEAYLPTLNAQWEQDFLQLLRAETVYYDDVWIGMNSETPKMWTTGEPVTFDRWGVNQPVAKNKPALLSSADGQWRTHLEGVTSNHSYCCEFQGDFSRGWSGALRVTPYGTEGSHPWKSVIGYKEHRTFFPFIHVDMELSEQTKNTEVFGMTVQMERKECFYPNGTSRAPEYVLALDPPDTADRFMMCPSSDKCPGKELLTQNCAFYFTRDDGFNSSASVYIEMLKRVKFSVSSERRMVQGETIKFTWTLWSNASLPIFLDVSTGHQFWCADADASATFNDAMNACRTWHGDGYLTTIQSSNENDIFNFVRGVADNYTQGPPFKDSVWIGHQRNNIRWVNNDDFNYDEWASGQPDMTGPTQASTDGMWRNILASSLNGPAKASYCCERNGFSGPTLHLMGDVIVTGPTESISLSTTVEKNTVTLEATQTRALTTAAIIPSHLATDTASITATETLELPITTTTTLSIGTHTEVMTRSMTFSDTVTTSKSEDPTQTPYIEVLGDPDRDDPLEGVVDSDAIRQSPPEKNHISLRTVTFRAHHTNFRAGNEDQFFYDRVKLEVTSESLFGFSAVKDRLIQPHSYVVNATHLSIVFLTTDIIDIRDDEILLVDIDRSVTYLEDEEEARLPQFKIRILHGDEASGIATVAIVFSTALAAIGSPQAFKDQQNMALFGAMRCARSPSRVVYRAGNRIISPLRFGDGLFPPWIGAFGPSYAFFMGHILFFIYRIHGSGKLHLAWQSNVLEDIAAKARFPSYSVLVMQLLHLGVTFFSIEIYKYSPSLFEMIMGGWGLLFSSTLTILIFYWSFKFKGMSFFEYTPAEMANVPPVLKYVVPTGQWGPTESQQMCRWIVGEYDVLQYASMEYFMGWATSGLAAWMPADLEECTLNYTIMGVYYIVCTLVVILLRPYRTYFGNGACVLSYLLLAAMMLCGGALVKEPKGLASVVAHIVRWAQTSLCMLRGIVGLAILRLEYKLISERRRLIAAEKARQEREMRVVNILDERDAKREKRLQKDAGTLLGGGGGGGGGDAGSPKIDPTFGFQSPTGKGKVLEDEGPASPTGLSGIFRESSSAAFNPLSPGSPNSPLGIPVNRSIYSPAADKTVTELDRRRKLMDILNDSVGPRAGHLPQGGVKAMPSWMDKK